MGSCLPLYFFGYIMDYNEKLPLILFSGGLDSSYLLQEKLKEGNVEILYVRSALNEIKMEEEIKRRENIIKILEEKTGNKVRDRHLVDLGSAPFGEIADQKFTQPAMWLNGALIASDSRKHSELCVGYVNGDSIMFDVGHIHNAWHSLQSVCKTNQVIPIVFPLAYQYKQDILRFLEPSVTRLIWYCEMPVKNKFVDGNDIELSKVRPCGNCTPCVTMATTLFKWRKINKKPYWKFLLHLLRVEKCIDKNNLISSDITTLTQITENHVLPPNNHS